MKIASTSAGYGSSFSIKAGSDTKHATAESSAWIWRMNVGELTDDDNVILQVSVQR